MSTEQHVAVKSFIGRATRNLCDSVLSCVIKGHVYSSPSTRLSLSQSTGDVCRSLQEPALRSYESFLEPVLSRWYAPSPLRSCGQALHATRAL